MSDQEQRDIMRRGFVIAGCGLLACVLLPVIGVRYETQRLEAAFQAEAVALALAATPGDAVRENPYAASLLDHEWLRSVGYSFERSPRTSLNRFAMYARDEGAVMSVVRDLAGNFDYSERVGEGYDCLSQAIYYEAGHESPQGKMAVAEVIMNRVADHRYPNSVCEVVYQGATRTTGCQFTFTCDGALRRRPDAANWQKSRTVAAHVMMGLYESRTAGATHYHATYVDPIWNVGLVRTRQIGAHIFYRFPRGNEWVQARNAVAQKKAYRARLASYEAQGYGVVPSLSDFDAVNALQLKDNAVTPAP